MQTIIEEKTTGLNNEINGEVNTGTPSVIHKETQEVLIYSNRGVLIKMVNNILKSLGDKRKVSQGEDFESIMRIVKSLYYNHNLKLHHLLGQSNQQLKRNGDTEDLIFYHLYGKANDNFILKILVNSGNEDLWSEIIKLYSNSEWIIDHYFTDKKWEELSFEGLFYSSTTIICNKDGLVEKKDYTIEDIDYLEDLYPVHFGYIKNMYYETQLEVDMSNNCIPLDKGYIPLTFKISNEGEIISDISVGREDYRYKIREVELNWIKWEGFVKQLKVQKAPIIDIIDKFSPNYYRMVEE